MKTVYPKYYEAYEKKGIINLRLTGLNLFLGFLIIVIILSILANQSQYRVYNDLIFLSGGLLSFILVLYLGFFAIEKPNHKPIGSIFFAQDSIQLLDELKTIKYEHITQFKIGLIRGEKINQGRNPIVFPQISAGQNSFIIISNQTSSRKIYLRFNDEKDQKSFEHIIRDQYSRGRIKLKTLYLGLNLGYQEIQRLKETAYNKA